MESEIFCLCEYASFSDGKLNINGLFDLIRKDSGDEIFPLFFIVGLIRFTVEESGKSYKLMVKLMNPNSDSPTRPMESTFQVARAIDSDSSTFQFLTKYEGLNIKKSGNIILELYVDGRLLKSKILYIRDNVK